MPKNALIYFLKAPRAGEVKTRLALTIGEESATRLYTLMCEHLLTRPLPQAIDAYIAYDDPKHETKPSFFAERSWFYQCEGDLGERMKHAFTSLFAQGFDRVVLVGSDIPELDENVLQEAFLLLQKSEAILSPTVDGGYYLIGFHRDSFCTAAFEGIVYSQSDVYEKTLAKLSHLKLTHGVKLQDVDTLDDLKSLAPSKSALSHRIQTFLSTLPRISVVIPVYCEDETLLATLSHLRRNAACSSYEIIVVDTTERTTVERFDLQNVRIALSEKGRAAQMNEGLRRAQGDFVLFLHADTLLPKGWDELIEQTLHVRTAGAFSLGIDDAHPWLRFIEKAANFRARLTRVPYGDQGLFFQTSFLRTLGGFADIPLMEDVELMRRLKQQGKSVALLRENVLTSSRRWHQEGLFYTTFRNRVLSFLYWAGVHPSTLKRRYPSFRRKA
jgi:rSAM/selenodomain-associated transferase 2/rSAM/selenodomain-associated transferase 1